MRRSRRPEKPPRERRRKILPFSRARFRHRHRRKKKNRKMPGRRWSPPPQRSTESACPEKAACGPWTATTSPTAKTWTIFTKPFSPAATARPPTTAPPSWPSCDGRGTARSAAIPGPRTRPPPAPTSPPPPVPFATAGPSAPPSAPRPPGPRASRPSRATETGAWWRTRSPKCTTYPARTASRWTTGGSSSRAPNGGACASPSTSRCGS
mmetsp:Transcript_20571/g.46666  ORF Transcript_20571/g.46666 Transcript_20571/m.46666 type:complete len:209 (+) Transcript_20571:95-721(+)